MEALFYLDLPAGAHEFGVRCDDGFRLTSGATLNDQEGLVLVESIDDPYDGTFQVIVDQAGVYPFRLVWFERTGEAHLELFTVEPGSGERVLVNDPASPVQAYQNVSVVTIVLESASDVAGTYAAESGAVIDSENGRITVAAQGETRFYRLTGPNQLRITSTELQANGEVVMTYEEVQ